MKEEFIRYLWQCQYFRKSNLKTTEGKPLTIYHTGYANYDAGPDFYEAKIKIDDLEWIGSVEIHVRSSDWLKHKHDYDTAYGNVVLHVVWENDLPIHDQQNRLIPTLELKNIADKNRIMHYERFMQNDNDILCGQHLQEVEPIIKASMFEKVLIERLHKKANNVLEQYQQNDQQWEQTAYNLLAYAMGLKINAEPMLQLSKITPYYLIQKLRHTPTLVEALLFGQAGMLSEKYQDDYPAFLLREYNYLCHKHNLSSLKAHRLSWKFLRTRPANFPSVRIAQLCAILTYTQNIFSLFTDTESYLDIMPHFYRLPTNYWHTHYMFDKSYPSQTRPVLGQQTAHSLLINAVIPVLAAYSLHTKDDTYLQRALSWLSELSPEKNSITKKWQLCGEKIKTAFDAQALIGLYNDYCKEHKCLRCEIGNYILKK